MRWSLSFLLLAGLAGGCATPPSPSDWSFVCASDLPPELCAAVVAGAVRQALPFSDAQPRFAGAMITQARGDYAVCVAQEAGAGWRMLGDRRLQVAVARNDGQPLPVVTTSAANQSRATAADDRLAVRIAVTATAAGSEVRGQVDDRLRTRVQPAVERALRLAADPTNAPGHIDDEGLRRLVAHRLVYACATAAGRGDLDAATPWLHNAIALGADVPELHQWLAELAHRRGHLAVAREQRWQAMLSSDDPTQRARIAATLGTTGTPGRDPAEDMLRAARRALADGHAAAAADLLHSARRVGPAPARDYRL
ncbi:MAG: hypothetical protein KDC48_18175, partial [Planctomycetes bacterium]|nr:hypothetical protein [Planctomycetota bacterium]